jgi:hypothetical protein
MAFVRNVAFPFVWKALSGLHLTQEGIHTHEIKVYADGVANLTADILADLHIGGVHRNLNEVLIASQKKANEIIGSTPCIMFDIWDRFTLGSKNHAPTWAESLINLGDFFFKNALQWEWQQIWWVDGNHDRRMVEKVEAEELTRMMGYMGEFGFKQILKPQELAGGRVHIHGMPCYNTQKDLYTPEAVKELIWNINNQKSGINIVMVHNPDGVRQIEAMKAQLGLRINVPTLFLCGHTHGLLGFQDIPFVGQKLAQWARKWIDMQNDTPYISGYYPATTGEPYGTFVSQGMGDQADIFRVWSGGRERPIFRFVDKREDADIVLG